VGGPIWTKFGSLMQNSTSITAKWSGSKPEVEFQYGGRLFFQIKSSNISAVNGDVSTKFGMLIDFDLLNTKPEVLLSGREMDMTSYFRSGCSDLNEIR